MTENRIVRQLRGIASKLTNDAELQKDLMQEMFVHLVQVETSESGQTLSWYLKSCEFHARNYLKLGRSIDSLKRARNGVPYNEVPSEDADGTGNGAQRTAPPNQIEIQGEIITNDIVNVIIPRLSETQQQILFLLLKGCGVRETAREIGITHPAVIKHRKKIARIARELLQDSGQATANPPGPGPVESIGNLKEGSNNGSHAA
ncbi:MAG TPA: sigma-70 family RNA polymerase sigma factor [Verrucomicrobiae bacterium]|nr:sigma-70 family RNA polymerase sigma factor [Verrucomicrobiae bacterium]